MAEVIPIHGTSARAKIRHPLVAFGLVFLTLGIYYLVWYYKVNRESAGPRPRNRRRDTSRQEPAHLIAGDQRRLAHPRAAVRLLLQNVPTHRDRTGSQRHDSACEHLGWFLSHVIGVFTLPIEMIYAQSELNRIWRGETGRAPARAVVATS